MKSKRSRYRLKRSQVAETREIHHIWRLFVSSGVYDEKAGFLSWERP